MNLDKSVIYISLVVFLAGTIAVCTGGIAFFFTRPTPDRPAQQ